VIFALAVVGLLRAYTAAGDPALAFTLSADATFFRLDAATYPLAPACAIPATSDGYRCLAPLLGSESRSTPHKVTPCKTAGSVTSCGLFKVEANLVCTCETISAGGGCPGDLFPAPPPNTPANLTATAVSSSEILLTWDALPCN